MEEYQIRKYKDVRKYFVDITFYDYQTNLLFIMKKAFEYKVKDVVIFNYFRLVRFEFNNKENIKKFYKEFQEYKFIKEMSNE